MNEIIMNIIAGIPIILLAFVFIGLLWLYFCIIAWAWKSRRDWLVCFLVLIPLCLFFSVVSYLIGSLI